MEGRRIARENSLTFIMAGNATVTFLNRETGNRFTYRISKADNKDIYFVGLLNGTDNENDYLYMGTIFDKKDFRLTKSSRVTKDALSYKIFMYVFYHLSNNIEMPEKLEIWHEGTCGRCGRKLTVPESIESGIGPECAKRMHFIAGMNFVG